MTTKDITTRYREVLQKQGYTVEAKRSDTSVPVPFLWDETRQHLLWMLDEMDQMTDQMAQLGASDQTTKWNRWLGFVQGALWASDLRTIDEMRADTRDLVYV